MCDYTDEESDGRPMPEDWFGTLDRNSAMRPEDDSDIDNLRFASDRVIDDKEEDMSKIVFSKRSNYSPHHDGKAFSRAHDS